MQYNTVEFDYTLEQRTDICLSCGKNEFKWFQSLIFLQQDTLLHDAYWMVHVHWLGRFWYDTLKGA